MPTIQSRIREFPALLSYPASISSNSYTRWAHFDPSNCLEKSVGEPPSISMVELGVSPYKVESENVMQQSPQIGDRITDGSAPPDEIGVRDWMGPQAFAHWVKLRSWIHASYPGVFAPEWLYGGKNRGWSLRYKKTKAFCTIVPEYMRLSIVVVLGEAEREKFEARRDVWRSQLVKLYDQAKTYPDGKFLTVAISSAEDRREVMELLIMKRPPPSRGAGKSPFGQ